jgi:hypothetical protein
MAGLLEIVGAVGEPSTGAALVTLRLEDVLLMVTAKASASRDAEAYEGAIRQ